MKFYLGQWVQPIGGDGHVIGQVLSHEDTRVTIEWSSGDKIVKHEKNIEPLTMPGARSAIEVYRNGRREIADLKRQLADALQQLHEQRIAIRADVIERVKAEARKQAFEDALKIFEDTAEDGDFINAICAKIDALRRELDKPN